MTTRRRGRKNAKAMHTPVSNDPPLPTPSAASSQRPKKNPVDDATSPPPPPQNKGSRLPFPERTLGSMSLVKKEQEEPESNRPNCCDPQDKSVSRNSRMSSARRGRSGGNGRPKDGTHEDQKDTPTSREAGETIGCLPLCVRNALFFFRNIHYLSNRRAAETVAVLLCVILLGVAWGCFRYQKSSAELSRDLRSAVATINRMDAQINETTKEQDAAQERLAHLKTAVDDILVQYGVDEGDADIDSRNDGRDLTIPFQQRVRTIVAGELEVFEADKTGVVDHAIASAGGRIASHSEVLRSKMGGDVHFPSNLVSCMYRLMNTFAAALGFSTVHPLASEIVLQPGASPGRCLPLVGSNGYIDIKTRDPISISGVSIEHAPRRLVVEEDLKSAIKHFKVYRIQKSDDSVTSRGDRSVELGQFQYDIAGRSLQSFKVATSTPTDQVRIQVLSNHGNPKYTCIYRIRIHGNKSNTDKIKHD